MKPTIWLLASITVFAFLLRVYNIMHGLGAHPDERHVVMTAMRLSLDNLNPGTFAYGSLPFYILWVLSEILRPFSEYYQSYDGYFFIGRSVSAVAGTLTVFVTYLLARDIYKRSEIGILAALLLATNVFHLQLSRFTTVDVLLTFFTMLSLLFMVWLSQSGKAKDAVFAGLTLSMAVATKLGALSLFVPLVITLVIYALSSKQYVRSFILLVVSGIVMAVGLFLFQPYMFLDYATYLAHNREQVDMVRGLWRPPYTIQYEATLPYIYPLKQIFFYTMGPPVALVAFGGVVLAVVNLFKKPASGATILLALVLPVFFLVGGYQVKFPRYLLPLYPLFCVFAALLLIKVAESLKALRQAYISWLPAVIVAAYSILYCLSFMHIYYHEHVYRISSKWIYENIEPQSTILQVHHWDDVLPLHLPGFPPNQYKVLEPEYELPLYASDTREKFKKISQRLSTGDYIIFPTARLYGALMRVPEEFPYSNAFFQLLFSEALGYEFIQTFKIRPQLGEKVFDNDLADESLTVYDHPKVTILKNREYLSGEEIFKRIIQTAELTPLPDRKAVMTLNINGKLSFERTSFLSEFTFARIVLWFLALQLLSLAMLPLLGKVLPNSPDGGYGISKVTGLLIFGYLSWIIPHLGLAPFGWELVWTIFVLLLASAVTYQLYNKQTSRNIYNRIKPHILPVEALFLGGAVLFMLIRAYHPEIFWGEKTMNLSFLNYLIRLDYPPPEDPWAAGNIMGYYYLSTYFYAALHHLTGLHSGVGYNISIATIAALLLSACYSAVLWLAGKRSWALFGAVAVVLLSNPEVLRLVFFSERAVDFHLFWASARLFTIPAINEYPLWTLLFADLHAHLIAYPFVVLLLVTATRFVEQKGTILTQSNISNRIFYGFVLGALFLLNSWDAVSFAVITAVLLLYPIITLDLKQLFLWKDTGRIVGRSLVSGAVLSIVALLVISPYLLSSHNGDRIHWGWVHGEFDEANQLFRHFGHWLLIVFTATVLGAFSNGFKKDKATRIFNIFLWLSIPFLLALLSYADREKALPWGVLIISAMILGLSSMSCWRNNASEKVRYFSVLLTSAGLIIALSQMLFVMDRMNTIFKFYNSVWFLLGIAAMGAFPLISKTLLRFSCWRLYPARCWLVILYAGLLICALGMIINIYIMLSHQRVTGPRPTLNGTAYLHAVNKDEALLIDWMRQHISDTPVQLEAQGHAYGPFTRIVMHTGLPTVLGFEHHVRQRGTPHSEVLERKQAVEEIYSTIEPERAHYLLSRYNVSYVTVSYLEHETYPVEGLEKFSARSDLFELIFESGSSQLYRVRK